MIGFSYLHVFACAWIWRSFSHNFIHTHTRTHTHTQNQLHLCGLTGPVLSRSWHKPTQPSVSTSNNNWRYINNDYYMYMYIHVICNINLQTSWLTQLLTPVDPWHIGTRYAYMNNTDLISSHINNNFVVQFFWRTAFSPPYQHVYVVKYVYTLHIHVFFAVSSSFPWLHPLAQQEGNHPAPCDLWPLQHCQLCGTNTGESPHQPHHQWCCYSNNVASFPGFPCHHY